MAQKKKHWAVSTDDLVSDVAAIVTARRKFRLACGMWAWVNSAKESGPLWSLCGAAVYRDLAASDPDWYCSRCAEAARLALAMESAPNPTSRCTTSGCGSYAINPGQSGRDDTSDLDLCDVCHWRKRAESATWPNPRLISEAPTDEAFLGFVSADKKQVVLPGWYRMTAVCEVVTDHITGWMILGAAASRDQYFAAALITVTHFLPLPPEVR